MALLLENEFSVKEKKYIQVRIHSACCNMTILILDLGYTMIDAVSGIELMDGMILSIRHLQKTKHEHQEKLLS